MLINMINQAQYDLLNYPYRSLGYFLAYPFKVLSGRNNDPIDRMAWPNALLAKAMMDYYKKHVNSEEAKEISYVVKRYYDRWIFHGKKLYNVDNAYAGMALIDLHQITKNQKYKDAVDAIYQYVLQLETDDKGSIIYRPKEQGNYIFVDSIGAVCPFLAKYGRVYGDIDATTLAITQIQNYLERGMDDKLLLPYHGYDHTSGMKLGIIGWGLGVGKLMMGMSETLYYINNERPEYEGLRMAYRRIVDKAEAYQMEGGLYNWQLSAKDGPADTAATAMILYSIAQSLEDKVLIGIHKSRMLRGVDAIKACIQEDGTLPGASKETDRFNNYPIDFGAYPWALGPALALMVMINEEPEAPSEYV